MVFVFSAAIAEILLRKKLNLIILVPNPDLVGEKNADPDQKHCYF